MMKITGLTLMAAAIALAAFQPAALAQEAKNPPFQDLIDELNKEDGYNKLLRDLDASGGIDSLIDDLNGLDGDGTGVIQLPCGKNGETATIRGDGKGHFLFQHKTGNTRFDVDAFFQSDDPEKAFNKLRAQVFVTAVKACHVPEHSAGLVDRMTAIVREMGKKKVEKCANADKRKDEEASCIRASKATAWLGVRG